jgi:hypothetical protein
MFLSFGGLPISKPMPDPDSPKCRPGASRKNALDKQIEGLTTEQQRTQHGKATAKVGGEGRCLPTDEKCQRIFVGNFFESVGEKDVQSACFAVVF